MTESESCYDTVRVSCCLLSNLAAAVVRKSVILVFVQKKELDDLANKIKQHSPQICKVLSTMPYFSLPTRCTSTFLFLCYFLSYFGETVFCVAVFSEDRA